MKKTKKKKIRHVKRNLFSQRIFVSSLLIRTKTILVRRCPSIYVLDFKKNCLLRKFTSIIQLQCFSTDMRIRNMLLFVVHLDYFSYLVSIFTFRFLIRHGIDLHQKNRDFFYFYLFDIIYNLFFLHCFFFFFFK